MLYSIRYLLAVDQYTQVAPLLAMGDVIVFTQFLYMKYEHFTYPVLPDLCPFIFWSILFKRIAGFVGLVFCYCNSESPAKPIYVNTFSNWHASTFCVWFANSHESVGMLHDQVYLENGLKPFHNGLTIIFVVGHDTKHSVPCYVVEGQALCHALGRWPKETEIPRSMLYSKW